MASFHILSTLVITILISQSGSASTALLPSLGDEFCKGDICGKGNCKVSTNSTFGFECECEDGWKQTRFSDDDDLSFLPCVMPNCTFNTSCQKAPAPAAAPEKKPNASVFDPCRWSDCGGGKCNRLSMFRHACECQEGYYNLLNISSFPCFKECALEGDCVKLGINMSNNGSNPSSSLPQVDTSHAMSLIPGCGLDLIITMATAFVLVLYT